MNLCNSSHNDKTPLESRVKSESVVDLAVTESGVKRIIPPSLPFSQVSTGIKSVGFQPQWLIARRYCGTSKAQTPRTNPIFGWEAACKAESMIGTPLASTDLYPVQITGGEFLNLD